MSRMASPIKGATAHYGGSGVAFIAAVMFVVIVVSTTTMWPISLLGYAFNDQTFLIDYLEPQSPATQAGLQVGDRILALYNRPIEIVDNSFLFRFIGKPGSVAPMVLQRGDQILATKIEIPSPSPEFQATKLAFMILSLVCWVTGIWIGVVRQHNVHGSVLISLFWLGMSGITGSLLLADITAPPLMRIIEWTIPALFVPLSIYIHVLFPSRPLGTHLRHSAIYIFGIAWLIVCMLAVGAYAAGLSVVEMDAVLRYVVPLEIIGALGIVAWMLGRAYKRSVAAKTRRQIRLIANACLSVALLEILLFVIPGIVLGQYIIDPNWGIVACGAVPLAYFAGGVTSDLYRLDRVASRVFLHLLATTILVIVLVIIELSLPIGGDVAIYLGAVAFVALYSQLHRLLSRTIRRDFSPAGVHPVIETAISALTRTLDAPTLVTTLAQGIRDQFGQPALAIYTGNIHGDSTLNLTIRERMAGLPSAIPAGALTDTLTKAHQVIDTIALSSYGQSSRLTPVEEQIVADPAVALWCPIVHSEGYLLGLMVLGYRSDLDPYRPDDRRSLQRLVDAAGLAFTNSAALEQQREAEEQIRDLYHRLLQGNDVAARKLARELHGDVINGVVMLNLFDLEKIVQDAADSTIRARILTIIDGEHTLVELLRSMCEQLHPTVIDDPLGLPDAIQAQLEKVEWNWDGYCTLQVQGEPLLLNAEVQREALRVTEEALSNVVKHADATAITVNLRYPQGIGEDVMVEVVDDGRGSTSIIPKSRHWGVRTMQEAARMVQGRVTFVTKPGEGTRVILSFPALYNAVEDSDATRNCPSTSSRVEPVKGALAGMVALARRESAKNILPGSAVVPTSTSPTTS